MQSALDMFMSMRYTNLRFIIIIIIIINYYKFCVSPRDACVDIMKPYSNSSCTLPSGLNLRSSFHSLASDRGLMLVIEYVLLV